MVRRPLVVFTTLLVLSWAAVGQSHSSTFGNSLTTGSVTGMVRAGDQPAHNARVEVKDLATGQVTGSAYTTPNGSFEIDNLPLGAYEIRATVGLNDTMDRIDLRSGGAYITLHLPAMQSDAGDGASVSVAQFRVPRKAREAFHKAERALEKQKLDQAEAQVEKALTIAPAYADALTLRALLRMDAGRLPEAIDDLENAIHDDPSYSLAYIVMGAAFNQSGRFDEAIREVQRGMSLNPASWQAHYEMGKAFVGKGDFPTAIRNLDRAEEMAPQDYAPLHLVKAHALLGMRNYTDAMTELEMYLQKDPNGKASPQARETLAKVKAFVATKK